MKVTNKTRKKIIAKSSKTCSSPLSKAKGLMFSKPLKNKCLIFEFKPEQFVNLHMFFVFFPIDILFLDKNKRVVDLKQNIKPFTPIIKSRKKSKYVIEMPTGTITKTRTKLRDLIQF